MTTFNERERGEETKYKHDLEMGFKIRNRRNKLLGLWIARDYLGLEGDEAAAYAKEIVMADFDSPGNQAMLARIKGDVEKAGKSLSDHQLDKHLKEFEVAARQQVMAE